MNLIGEARLFIDQKQTLGLASARVIWITRVKIGFLQSSFYEVMWSSLANSFYEVMWSSLGKS